jgi:hypothetical protein
MKVRIVVAGGKLLIVHVHLELVQPAGQSVFSLKGVLGPRRYSRTSSGYTPVVPSSAAAVTVTFRSVPPGWAATSSPMPYSTLGTPPTSPAGSAKAANDRPRVALRCSRS